MQTMFFERLPSLLSANHSGWFSAVMPALRKGPMIEPSEGLS